MVSAIAWRCGQSDLGGAHVIHLQAGQKNAIARKTNNVHTHKWTDNAFQETMAAIKNVANASVRIEKDIGLDTTCSEVVGLVKYSRSEMDQCQNRDWNLSSFAVNIWSRRPDSIFGNFHGKEKTNHQENIAAWQG